MYASYLSATRLFWNGRGYRALANLFPPWHQLKRCLRRLASTVFQHLVAADNASETLASLKRIHGLMPYFMLKAALKISNPVGMIRSACFHCS